ncbi:MAG: LytTR family DNA-binding domain-containing protein [Actinomycetota bacterium]|nr:LytTR family DNA-binding domain-containing protein [Actinomycetota bacterium]
MTGGGTGERGVALSVLVVDDEAPACEELAYLLGHDDRIGQIRTASNAVQALKLLNDDCFDVVFCDIKMPGLDGVDFARTVSRFNDRPQIVFVTAYDHAVDAFELQATDYLMKPVRPDRLGEAVRRVVSAAGHDTGQADDETIAVELAGVTRFVRRSQVRYVEAQGDYARLHTANESHLLRIPLSTLEHRWAEAGFVRIHRSTLVALAHIDEVRFTEGRYTVSLGAVDLLVSRRHSRDLRERLAQP